MVKLDLDDFMQEVNGEDLSDVDLVKDFITSYLEELGYNVLYDHEDPNENYLNQYNVVSYSTSEWFGFIKTEPEYDDSYNEYVTTWIIEDNNYVITEYIDNSGDNCFKVEIYEPNK